MGRKISVSARFVGCNTEAHAGTSQWFAGNPTPPISARLHGSLDMQHQHTVQGLYRDESGIHRGY